MASIRRVAWSRIITEKLAMFFPLHSQTTHESGKLCNSVPVSKTSAGHIDKSHWPKKKKSKQTWKKSWNLVVRREESGYLFKAIILSWGNKHSEGWSCTLGACYKQELHVIYFWSQVPIQNWTIHSECQNRTTTRAPEPRQLCHLHQQLSLIVLVESGEGSSTQENKQGRSGPTRLTVQGQPWSTLCGAGSPARLENGTLPSFVNPPFLLWRL